MDTMCAFKLAYVGMESVVGEIDIFTTTTGNFKTITSEHMKEMKNVALVGNFCHSVNEL
jgi:adenosylhomocysteinase